MTELEEIIEDMRDYNLGEDINKEYQTVKAVHTRLLGFLAYAEKCESVTGSTKMVKLAYKQVDLTRKLLNVIEDRAKEAQVDVI